MSCSDHLIGVDEAGVGCLFGDLVAAAVVLPLPLPSSLSQLADSKKLSRTKREALAEEIKRHCQVGIGTLTSQEINRIGLGAARNHIFHLALDDLLPRLNLNGTYEIIVDGTIFSKYRNFKHSCIPKADSLYACVSAASIVAKTARDKTMREWCALNPSITQIYDLDHNMGYITPKHKSGIRSNGMLPEHRNYAVKL